MPEVALLFFAEAATGSPQGTVSALNLDLHKFHGKVPFVADPFAFVAKLIFGPEELDREHKLHFHTTDPDSEPTPLVYEVSFGKPPPPTEPGNRTGATIVGTIQGLEFKKYGKHTTRVYVNDQLVREIRISVKPLDAPELPPGTIAIPEPEDD
ncbi:MAG TPA: hypothetical protein VKE40_08595 [Gemmataceae bacterium]|nr:hypothetical protein [Gemmataceae bacterium]